MPEKLTQRRFEYETLTGRRQCVAPEVWLAALAAGACLRAGMERRSPAGALLTVAGAALAWWGFGEAAGDGRARWTRT